jgi:gliding motility-associated-like protein
MKKAVLFFSTCLILLSYSFNTKAVNYYWINGSGNWSDLTHWATTSGGSTLHTQIPTALDDVYFDANSFALAGQIVTLDGNPSLCHSMNWTGALFNPTLAGISTNTLKIYGSLVFINAMTISFQGNINFESTTLGNTISTNSKQLNNDIYFMGNNGGWTLLDSLYIAGGKSLSFFYGNLNTNNQNINTYRFVANQTNTRTLTLGSSVITIRYEYGTPACYIYTSNLTINAGTSKFRFTGGSGTNAGGMYIYDSYLGLSATLYDVEFLYAAGNAELNSEGLIHTNFHNVTFKNSGLIEGTNTFNDLNLTGGKNYQIENGVVQTILNSLNLLNSSCMAVTSIQSSVNGSFGSFSKASGSVTIDYVVLRDVHATGGAVFTANNATDLGNNTGWIINPSVPRTLYWIGGTGNWDDQSHWSLTSGGSGPQCIPSPNDDVFFDANSFSGAGQSVNINVSNATCRSMVWTGALFNPALSGSNTNVLKIYGSLALINAMTIPFQGNINFEATTPGKTILTSGVQLNNDIYFMGNNGGWTLLDSLYIAGGKSLSFFYGNLNTNNQNINTYRFVANQTNTRTLTLGSSVITIRYEYGTPACYIYTSNLTINAGTSKFRFTGGSGTNAGGMYIYDSYLGLSATLYDVEFLYAAGNAELNSEGLIHTNFHNVTFKGSGLIEGTNTFYDLNFAAGNSYILESNIIQTIQHHWQIQGTCTSYVILQAATLGSFASVSQAVGSVIGYNIHMRDVHAVGGAVFNAYNSVDLGGNTGWNFSTLPPMANPDSISGPISLCAGQNGVVYSIPWVSGAISYIWSVPPGVNITSGQGDTLITVNFNGTVNDTIEVVAFNGCAGSSVSSIVVSATAPAFAALSNVCITVAPFALTGGSPGGGTYAGPGVIGGIFNPATAGAGTHTISYMISSGPCADTLTQTIIVLPAPSITIAPSNPSICDYQSVLITAGGASTYSWTPATGLDSTNISHPTANPGTTTTYTVTGTSSGCTASQTVTVNVNSAPSVSILPVGPTICDYQSVQITASGATSYSWTPATGLDFTNIANPHANPGTTTTYTVTGTTGSCTASQTVTVNVNSAPSVTILPVNPTICDYQSIQITASGATSYSWTPATGLDFTNIANPNANPGTTTTYTVTGTTGSCTASQTVTVNVNSAPSVSILPVNPTICDYQSVQITASGATSYSWTPATGLDFTNIANPNADPGTTTTYTVTGTTGSCTASQTVTVNVNSAPSVSILPVNPTICDYQSVQITASGATSYSWTPATGLDFTNINNPTANPGTSMTYTVTGTTGSCTASQTVTVNVNASPSIILSPANPAICGGDSIQLLATGATNYLWTPSTGLDFNNIANPNASPSSTTTYTVTGTTSGCSASETITVNYTSAINLSVTPTNPSICSGDTLQLTASGATVFSWSPSASLSDTSIANPLAFPATSTTFTIIGNTGSCFDTISYIVTVSTTPNVTINPATPGICSGDSIQLTASGASSFSWTPTAGLSSSTIDNPWASPSGSITYIVTGTTGLCSDTASVTVNVSTTPNISITPSTPLICSGDSVQLTASGASSYSWTPATGLSQVNINNPFASPSDTTTYVVTGTTGACSASSTVTVYVNPTPVVTVTPLSDTICSGQSTLLTAVGANTYVWTPTLGLSNPNVYNPTANPTSSTTYTVSGTTLNCSNTATVTITVNAVPSVSITPSAPAICSGDSVQLTATGASTYIWSPATGLDQTVIADPQASPGATTTYTVTGTTLGCSDSDLVTVTVNPIPVVIATAANQTICEGASVELNASGANTYSWTPVASLNSSTISNPLATPTTTTTYTVIGSSTSCTGSDAVTINVTDSPDITYLVGQESCDGANDAYINITITGGLLPYVTSWNTGENTEDLSALSSGSYIVTVTDSNGCAASKNFDIDPTGISCYEPHVYVPNIFSPNGDGNNDVLYIHGQRVTEVEMYIYDRWGEKVFATGDLTKGWDGTFRGKNCDPGVFYYFLKVTFDNDESLKTQGSITLVR